MRKIFFVFFSLLAVKGAAYNVTVQAKPAFFFPVNDKIHNVYGGGGMYGAEAAVRFWKYFDVWADGMIFRHSGMWKPQNHHTRFEMVPVGIGLKGTIPFLGPLIGVEPYFGAAAKYFYVNVHNPSPFTNKNVTKTGWGWGAKVGFSIVFPIPMLFDIYFEYIQKTFAFGHHHGLGSANVGGLIVGGAFGYRF